MDAILEILRPMIESLGGQYDWVVKILAIIGMLRVIFKPLMSLIAAVVAATPGVDDDSLLAKIQDNKIYKVAAYVLDWTASVKLPKPAVKPQEPPK